MTSISKNNGVMWLLVVNINNGIVSSMMYVNKCIMRLLVLNKDCVVMLVVNINYNCVMLRVDDVLSDNNCFNYWSYNWFHNNWLDDRLNNWLLFDYDVAILLCVNNSFLLNVNVNNVVSLEEELTGHVSIVEDVKPSSNSVVVSQLSNSDDTMSDLNRIA
jgi:hypothetical protein